MLTRLALPLVCGLLAALGGCKNDLAEQGDIVIRGVVVGPQPDLEAKASLVWVVQPAGPDYGHGQGQASAGAFDVRLRGVPPDEALRSGKVGVGLIALLPADRAVTDGSLPDEALEGLVGLSSRFAIIYRADDPPDGLDWAANFPDGLSCGRCVPVRPGATLETFEPFPCSSIEVVSGASLSSSDVCRWH